ncbi:MAG: DUF4869 domain-containing protein [Clostridiales bacterium]|jgi:hypothetical protein|nr:DUF4869 domain-containing protein [Clostridiales bacterium]MDR2752524.1 DUF4869 domain-containing protein [Clostridiales bacterium]
MLNIWLGNCDISVYDMDVAFEYYQEDGWFTDPYVIGMVKDVDKTELISHRLAYDYMGDPMNPRELSGGVKALILLYMIDNIIIDGNMMGNNCARWILDIGKRRDCYITLCYFLNFEEGIKSDDDFECRLLNVDKVIKSFDEYDTLFGKLLGKHGLEFEYWRNPPENFNCIMERDLSQLYEQTED